MPTDYYSVLVRAISALDPNSDEARRALYDRARLTVMDAGLTAAETKSERAALDAAIDRIEAEMRQASMRPASARHGASLSDRTEWAGTRLPQTRPGFLGAIAVLAAAVLIALVGYALWPRGSATDKAPDRPGASTAKLDGALSTDRSEDTDRSYILRRQLVYYRTIHPVGTAVIAKSQHYLYLVRPNAAAMRYTIGVGRECTNAVGLLTVSAKEERPEGRPQQSASTPSSAGAAGNGRARTLALGDTGHRIYGTNPPIKDGGTGCFALVNEDISDLYDRVEVGTKVVIH
jgi:L,D-transpeptidase catalytic domain